AANDAQLTRAVRHVAQVAGYEAMAYAPMMWNERGIGAIGVSRLKGAFSDKELALLQTFADQAVIAIQNTRLFNETRDRKGGQNAIPDTEEVSHAPVREIARLHGFRSVLWVPMVNGGVTIGIISVTRAKPGAFPSHHVQLLQTFADQAVIAIENTRLFNET